MSHIRALIAVLVILPGIHLPTLLMGLASSQPSCFCIINTSLNEPCHLLNLEKIPFINTV